MKNLCLIIFFLFSFVKLSQAESSSINSYYPAPIGQHYMIRLNHRSALTEPCNVGNMYNLSLNNLRFCMNDGTGSGTWEPWPGEWTQMEDAVTGKKKIFLTDIGDFPDLHVGIGTETPEFTLTIDGGASDPSGILATGTFGSGIDLTTSGAGTRLIWYPKKAAFRAGEVTAAQWDDASIGNYSAATGRDTTASGQYSVAVGEGTTASGDHSFAAGEGSVADGDYSFAVGEASTASGNSSFAAGSNSLAQKQHSTAIGNNVQATGDYSFASGEGTLANGTNAVAFGKNTRASGTGSIVFGQGLAVSGNYSVGIALNNQAGTDVSQSNTLAILGGNVGISARNPMPNVTSMLHVDSSNLALGTIKFFEAAGAAAGAGVTYTGGTDDYFPFIHTKDPLLFSNAKTAICAGDQNDPRCLTIRSGGSVASRLRGNVGIGTTNPLTKLHIVGQVGSDAGILIEGDSPEIKFFDNNDAVGTKAFSLQTHSLDLTFRMSDNESVSAAPFILIFHNSGNVTLGPNYNDFCLVSPKLYVNGNIFYTGSLLVGGVPTAPTTCSSQDCKDNIEDLAFSDAMSSIRSLHPQKYVYKSDEKKDQHLGFIAEDSPDAFTSKSKKAIIPMNIIASLTKVAQHQKAVLEKQEEELNELEGQIDDFLLKKKHSYSSF